LKENILTILNIMTHHTITPRTSYQGSSSTNKHEDTGGS